MPMAAPAAMATSIPALILTPAARTVVPSDLHRRRALRRVALPLLEVVQTRANAHESTGRAAAPPPPSAALGMRVQTGIVCCHAADGWHMREGDGGRQSLFSRRILI
jgi:hypothetical protein